ncbi:hypothetical protein AYO38_03035 [bacterium SCGC AG-212-C10]|nr:hypothetical protein AYO38_03035 [bacterium SCGC AG-212-C10]
MPAADSVGAAATPPPVVGAGACDGTSAGVIAGQTAIRNLTSAGKERQFRVHLPAKTDTGAAMPVVLNFHGYGSNALEQETYSGLVPLSDREGFLLVSPDGTGSPRGWASFSLIPTGTDDVRFVDDLIVELGRSFCIDTQRIYATGLSNGAFMSSRLGCVLSDRIAAIAPVAGVYNPVEHCGRPMPVLAFHGTADSVVPFDGGLMLRMVPYGGARRGISGWAEANGCSEAIEVVRLTDHVTRETHSSCTSPADLIVVDGGGHTWPGAFDVPALGPVTKEISAAELIWTFFAQFSLGR